MKNNQPLNTEESNKKGLISSFFNYLFNEEPKNKNDLANLIRHSEQKYLINLDTKDMLEGVLKIAELRVRDIMIPRAQIIALKRQQSLQQYLEIIVGSAHSRYPVINEDKDHIEGLLIAKDLLPFMQSNAEPFHLDKILRPVVVIPESKHVDRMLKEFRCQRYHMAIVVNEFGSVSGLITIEDILEEIVGEIADEYDEAQDLHTIRQINEHNFAIHALTTIEEFNNYFATNYPDDEVDTVGGLVMQAFGHLPASGETIIINDCQFKVMRADSRHIIQLQLTKPRTATTEKNNNLEKGE